MPHKVVGMTALFLIGLAIAIGVLFLIGTAGVWIAAVVLGVVAITMIIVKLTRIAAENRDRIRPSR